jgi:hypothetical protein
MRRLIMALLLCLPCLQIDTKAGEPVHGTEPAAQAQASADEFAGMSRSELRRALTDAEDAVYTIFNELNTDDRYDIICRTERRVTSHFSTRICKARLFRDTVEKHGRDFRDEGVHRTAKLDQEYHNRILRQKMHDLALANPQLAAALNRLRALQQASAARQK